MDVCMKANREWSSRPADERFGSLQALHASAVEAQKAAATTRRLVE